MATTRRKGQVALITGASSGIGAAIAKSLAKRGMRLALAGRHRATLRAVVSELPDATETLILQMDVGEEEQVRKGIERTRRELGDIDVVVCNAGYGHFGEVVDMTSEEFDGVIRTNLRGTFLCAKYALPSMYERKSGTLVVISSLAGKHGFAGGGAYSASKFGVMGLTESLFHEARTRNVRVVTICPGSVETNFFEKAGVDTPNPEKILQPEDVAAAVQVALDLPPRALIRELDIRPTNPR